MLKLILDHDFDLPVPSVDRSPFANHGRVFQANFLADGRQPGSGALQFGQSGSAVRIAWRPVWQKLTAIAVEAWVRVNPNGQRRNIIEGDGSFALFVNPDDTLEGSVFSLIDGTNTPTWHAVSSSINSPDGVVRRIPLNQWCKVVYHHDGITRARMFVDDVLIGVRGDFRSGPGPVAGAGVVIGNWTLANQYAFSGSIDRVRVWKHDDTAIARAFAARPITPEARDYWDEIWACLAAELNQDTAQRFRILGRDWDQLVRELFRAVHAASEEDRERFRRIIERYRAAWRSNTIDDPAAADALVALRDWITAVLGPAWFQRAEELARVILELWGHAQACIDPGRLRALDPEYDRFITNAVSRFSA